MSTLPLAPDGVFWTIQGEGALRGTPMVFIRLAGCSVGCAGCDTDYRVAERVSVDEILARVLKLQKRPAYYPHWVWITGGEPTDHDLVPLIDGLRATQNNPALATSGVRSTLGLDVAFLSVSPHSIDRWAQRGGTELKVVPGLNGMRLDDVLKVQHNFVHRYVQPLWHQTANGPEKDGAATAESLRECVEFVLAHPDWTLTDQGHKGWGLR